MKNVKKTISAVAGIAFLACVCMAGCNSSPKVSDNENEDYLLFRKRLDHIVSLLEIFRNKSGEGRRNGNLCRCTHRRIILLHYVRRIIVGGTGIYKTEQ